MVAVTKRLPSRLPDHVVSDTLYRSLWADLLSAFRTAQARVPLKDIEQAWRKGTGGPVFERIPFQEIGNRLTEDLTPVFAKALLHAAKGAAELLPSVQKVEADVLARLGFSFDQLNPFSVRWAEGHVARLILGLTETNRIAIRRLIVRMFDEGIPPRTAARLLKGSIGLTPRDSLAVLNYYRMLEQRNDLRRLARDATSALSASQRTRLMREAVLTQARLEKLVGTYQERLLRSRAEMIARTESTTAAIQGQLLLWDQLADRGLLDRGDVRMQWILTPDERLCPVCAVIPSLPDNLPPLGGRFHDDAGNQYVGPPAHPNCRCALRLVFVGDGLPKPSDIPPGNPKRRTLKPKMPRSA